jgi:leucyl aminopeptidase
VIPTFEVSAALPEAVAATGCLMGTGLEPLTSGLAASGVEELRGFAGEVGDALVRSADGRVEILVGIGDPATATTLQIRRAAATFARSLSKASTAALDLRGVRLGGVPVAAMVQGAVEGVAGATYRFERYASKAPEPSVQAVTIVVDEADLDAARAGCERGLATAGAVTFARDLANRTPGDLTPTALADAAVELAGRTGLTVEVLDEDGARAARLGGLLGVAAGSVEEPRLITLTYEPDEAVARRDESGRIPTVALVGKGITFDSGGLSLKPADSMVGMKMDMSGAAAVIATAGACRALGVGVRVVAIAPVTENMPSGRAIKPGDVLTTRSGKTIEVLNTDAEGRLVLADGLHLAAEAEPDAIVDIATLTGACVVALGSRIAGVMGNDSRVVGAVESAAGRAGEPVWRLPLPAEYRKDIDSQIADMKNVGKSREAGAIAAALLLEEFVADRPWAHLDIAGTANSDEERFEVRKGATGFAVRTLIDFVENFELAGPATADHAGVGR